MGYLCTAWILKACRLISKGMSMTFSSSTGFMKAVTDCNWLAEFPQDRVNRILSRLSPCSPETPSALVRNISGLNLVPLLFKASLFNTTSAQAQKYPSCLLLLPNSKTARHLSPIDQMIKDLTQLEIERSFQVILVQRCQSSSREPSDDECA